MLAWPTGLPEPSCSWITGCCRKGTPLCALADGCVTIASRVALPAVAVAVNVTGLPASVPDAAVRVLGPATAPSVHDVTAATPSAPVVTGLVGLTLPPPVPGANVTATSATGLPCWSRTITDGGTATAVPTGAAWPSPALIAMDAAAAAVTLTLAVAVTCVTPFSVALIVFVSALVELSVPVTWPVAPVGPVGWVRASFVPLAARVTVTPLTGFPNSSLAVTVIVAALAPPDAEMVPGSAATSDRAALGAPAVPVAVNVIGLPFTPGAVAVSVFWPATVPSVQLPTAAMPLALVVWLAPVMLPLPGPTANVTETPCTGLPFASFTITAGAVATALFTVAVCLSPPLTAMLPALPAVPWATKLTGLPARPADVAVRVFG